MPPQNRLDIIANLPSALERITQSVVKSHIETSQYSTEELKRMAWTLYNPEETRSYQIKVYMTQAYHSVTLSCRI